MSKTEMFCTKCGHKGMPQKITKGSSLFVELGIWFFGFLIWSMMSTSTPFYARTPWYVFFIPGLAYSIWRAISPYDGCSSCKGNSLIPADSPMAKIASHHYKEAKTEK